MSLRDNLQIMVVDDMSTSRGLIVQALESFGVQHIDSADNGADALARLTRKPVHLVLSDFNMPGMDGLQLLAALRAQPRTKAIGFILITGRPDRALVERGRALGLNNFLPKPFDSMGLRRCLEAVVGRL